MSFMPWSQHFFASTRGRIVLLLRRASHTVDELARELNLTDNAVRVHLATLERDGLVTQCGARRGGGKPAVIYDLTLETRQLFSKAYAPVLQELLEVLADSMSAEKLEEIMHTVGRRVATRWSIPPDELQTRLRHAVAILNELGGLVELEESEGGYTVQGYSCPLAVVIPGHPEICQFTRTLLTDLVGAPCEEHCERGKTIHCRFTLESAD